MGMLVARTMGIVPTVVFFSDALSPPFLPSCCVLAQVHLSGPFGAERLYATIVTLLTKGHIKKEGGKSFKMNEQKIKQTIRQLKL